MSYDFNSINLLLANIAILYSLKTPENIWIGIKREHWPEIG